MTDHKMLITAGYGGLAEPSVASVESGCSSWQPLLPLDFSVSTKAALRRLCAFPTAGSGQLSDAIKALE